MVTSLDTEWVNKRPEPATFEALCWLFCVMVESQTKQAAKYRNYNTKMFSC